MNFLEDVGQTLTKPWKEDVPVWVILSMLVLFAIVVWFTFDSLNAICKLEAFITENLP